MSQPKTIQEIIKKLEGSKSYYPLAEIMLPYFYDYENSFIIPIDNKEKEKFEKLSKEFKELALKYDIKIIINGKIY